MPPSPKTERISYFPSKTVPTKLSSPIGSNAPLSSGHSQPAPGGYDLPHLAHRIDFVDLLVLASVTCPRACATTSLKCNPARWNVAHTNIVKLRQYSDKPSSFGNYAQEISN